MRCFNCANEIVPLSDEERKKENRRIETNDIPCYYSPATVIEVLAEDVSKKGCNCTVICWLCFLTIEPDMWLSERYWTELRPAVAFDKLPFYEHHRPERDDPTIYESSQPPAK